MGKKERLELMQFINEVSFAVVDIGLYLDTHPCDKKALRYYHKYSTLREQALKEYAKAFGPLRKSDVYSECNWTWVDTPWPWQGGC